MKKIRFDQKTCMIQNEVCAKKLVKEFAEKGWSKSGLSCSIVSTRDKSIVWMN